MSDTEPRRYETLEGKKQRSNYIIPVVIIIAIAVVLAIMFGVIFGTRTSTTVVIISNETAVAKKIEILAPPLIYEGKCTEDGEPVDFPCMTDEYEHWIYVCEFTDHLNAIHVCTMGNEWKLIHFELTREMISTTTTTITDKPTKEEEEVAQLPINDSNSNVRIIIIVWVSVCAVVAMILLCCLYRESILKHKASLLENKYI